MRKEMSSYAVCVANRSAVFFHLNDHVRCLEDISEALENDYPNVRLILLIHSNYAICIAWRH